LITSSPCEMTKIKCKSTITGTVYNYKLMESVHKKFQLKSKAINLPFSPAKTIPSGITAAAPDTISPIK